MDWLVRFSLGLPPRAKDVANLRRALPELWNESFELEIEPIHVWFPYWRAALTNRELLKALREWVSEVGDEDDFFPDANKDCPSNNCPLRGGDRARAADSKPLITRFIVAAGGPKAKPPKASFLDLVRRTHPKKDPPREVILTDPYIFSDVSEEGLEGGFSNLVSYLDALGLDSDDSFKLRMTPSPKKGNITTRKNFERLLRKSFKNITLEPYASTLKFHDRFYVVRHRSGVIRGVFGPSINGLASNAIVLMGDITDLQPLKKLETWFG
jgi:hypothetical protein